MLQQTLGTSNAASYGPLIVAVSCNAASCDDDCWQCHASATRPTKQGSHLPRDALQVHTRGFTQHGAAGLPQPLLQVSFAKLVHGRHLSFGATQTLAMCLLHNNL